MQKRRSRYTIRDIAKMAGVSRSTVSLAINDSPRINEQTKKHVLTVISEVGYRPNHAARNLASRTSKTILVLLPEMDQAFSDGYFSESLSGILDAAAFHEYHLQVQSATELLKRENRPLKLFRQHTIDAVLSVGNLVSDQYLREMHDSGCPVLLVNSSLPGIPFVAGDALEAARKAIAHLHSLGHSRIGHIAGAQDCWATQQRSAGYKQAVEELGLEFEAGLLAQGGATAQSGYRAMKQLLARDEMPSAVFCATDLLAVGAMQAVRDAGLDIPSDIAVFGGDDAPAARLVVPQLSTIQPAMYAIGEAACEQMIRYLEEASTELPQRLVDLPLAIRDSCGASSKSRHAFPLNPLPVAV